MKDAGAKKLKLLKHLSVQLPALVLSEAKETVEEAPSVIAEAASKDDAEKMKEELEAAAQK